MTFYDNLGHGLPLTRREMLSRSANTLSAAVLAPSLLSLLTGTAAAASSNALPAYLAFDLNGGAALAGNFLVAKDEGAGSLLRAYTRLGWNPRAPGALDDSFGLPMAAAASPMLRGMRQTASAATLKKLRFGSFCHQSQADSQVNQLAIANLVAAAGVRGTAVSSTVGMKDSKSGGNSANAVDDPKRQPLFVSSIDDILASLSFGPALQTLPGSVITALTAAAGKLSAAQVSQLQGYSNADQLATLSNKYFAEVQASGGGGAATLLDPRLDPLFRQLYALEPETAADSNNAVVAAIVKNSLGGLAGPGVVTINGCDYHVGLPEPGEAKDLEIGQHIGRAVEAAAQMNKKLFLHIYSDGGIAANEGRAWSSDTNDAITLIGYFDPAGAPKQRRLQVGAFTDGQIADRTTTFGSDPALVAAGVFANYLQLAGMLDQFADLTGRSSRSFPTEESLIFDV